jgi:hypothetical protein
MQRAALLVLVSAVLATVRCTGSDDEIEYRGEHIKLTRHYADFDDYKNDPDNIHRTETARVQRLVMEAPIATQFPSRLEAAKAVGEIAFPGYGSSGWQAVPQADGSILTGFSVEVPRAQQDRCFALRCSAGSCALVDDFLAPDVPAITRVTDRNGTLAYSTQDGTPILERPGRRTMR